MFELDQLIGYGGGARVACLLTETVGPGFDSQRRLKFFSLHSGFLLQLLQHLGRQFFLLFLSLSLPIQFADTKPTLFLPSSFS